MSKSVQSCNLPISNGQLFPNWKEKRLRDLGQFKSGTGFPEIEQGGKTGVPFYKVSDMNLAGNETVLQSSNHYVSKEQISKFKWKPIATKAIVFAKVGAAIFLERKRRAENFLLDNNMMAFIPNKKLSIEFSVYLFARMRLSKYAQVGALPSYNSGDLASIKIAIPDPNEQQKIADALSVVDAKIEKLRHKRDLLKKYKHGLMQKLFNRTLRFTDSNSKPFPDWKNVEFLDFVETLPTRNHQILSSQIAETGLIPVIDQGKDQIAGYSDRIDKAVQLNEVIVFGDHTTELKYIDFKFVVGADGTKILWTKKCNLKYLFYFLQMNNVKQEGYKRHFSILKQLILLIPHPDEQQKIADALSAMNAKIAAVSDQLEKFEKFKKSLLQQMFV